MPIRYKGLGFLGFPGYRVGTDGSVWSCWKSWGRGTGYGSVSYLSSEWRKVKLSKNKYGRVGVRLHHHRLIKGFPVGRLILIAFTGSCPIGMEACHFPDRDPANNRLSNLMWGTHLENESHKRVHGTCVGNRGNVRGEANGSAVLNDDKVIELRTLYASGKYTYKELVSRFSIGVNTFYSVVKGKTWTHVGGPLVKGER